MIRKMKRRYLITNMALLSCILLAGLAILFGLLYHSEVQSSYSVMHTMMKESHFPPDGEMPKGEPPGEPPPRPEEETGTAGTEVTVSPLGFSYPEEVENRGRWTDVDPPPPYRPDWDDDCDDDRPGWGWGHNDDDWPQPPDWDNPPPWYDDDDEDHHDRPPWDDRYDDDPFPPPETEIRPPFPHEYPEETTAETTVVPIFAEETTLPAPDEPAVITEEPPPETLPPAETPDTQEQTETTTATTATTTTTTVIVPVEEGQYIPDAFIARVDGDGNIAAYAGNGSTAGDEQFRRVHGAMDSVRRHGARAGTVQVGENSYRFLYEPDDSGTYRLVLLDRTIELSALKRLLFIFFFITLIGLALMFLLSLVLANWTVTPVAAAWEKQKQFVADASHELKTPLAVISANTEVIMANPEGTVAEQEKWLGYIQSETMRMSKLITSLLSVARMDSRENRVHTEPLAMSETVQNVCLSFEPVIFERGKKLQTAIQRNVTLRTDGDNIRQLLSILLDNAVLHSLPKAEITVTLSRDAQGKIRLAVSNTARDIPRYQLDHLFDRFYRLDKEGSPNGSGLGLSIAKSIVHQMGGTLTVSSEHSLVTFLAAFP